MTAKGKINAAGIAKLVMAGTPVRVLVEVTESGALVATNRKTGVESVEIVKAEAYQTPRGWHRSGREYVLETSSGRRTVHVGPIRTFIETEESPAAVKRAHIEALKINEVVDEERAKELELPEEEAPAIETETPAEIDSAEELTLNSQGCKVDTNSTDEPEGDEMSTETTTEIPTQTAPETAPMEHTGSTVVALIERVWDRIRADHPELPRVVVTTGSGEFVKWGHFRPDSWKSGDEKLHEFFLASEALAKGAVQVLQTTIHEAAHTLARVRGQKDTSRQNRYHNKVFLTIAEELGLEHKASTPDKTHGFSFVTLTEATKEKYADLLEELTKELVLTGLLPFWLGGSDEEDEKGGEKITKPKGGEDEESKGKAQSGNLKAVCGCAEPNIIRLSRKVLDKGIVRCDECEELFRAE